MAWAAWGDCSTSCGDGVQQSVRECEAHTSDECPGSDTKTRTCNIQECTGKATDKNVTTNLIDHMGSVVKVGEFVAAPSYPQVQG